jgi:hypothetical protein
MPSSSLFAINFMVILRMFNAAVSVTEVMWH